MQSTGGVWGGKGTEYFYGLTPDVILDAAEQVGLRCTGRVIALNSMENRVYEVEVEVAEGEVRSPSDRARVIKFYRPGRWTVRQIEEEHRFLLDLREADVPVVAPIPFNDGHTLRFLPEVRIACAVFPKQGGRHPEEMTEEQLRRVGRQLARLHSVGASRRARHRLVLDVENYGGANLDLLLEEEWMPEALEPRYVEVVESICETAAEWLCEAECQRIHGDCHLGNLLWHEEQGPFWVDFDDMVNGPCVQDVWLIVPGRDEESVERREWLLAGYEELREFDRRTLRLIEPLRALRMVHFSGWIAKRWSDPAFPRKFEFFDAPMYWHEQLHDLEECWELMRQEGAGK